MRYSKAQIDCASIDFLNNSRVMSYVAHSKHILWLKSIMAKLAFKEVLMQEI